MNPFDFLDSINKTKKDLMKEDPSVEKDYNPYLINRGLSYFQDTILYANEINKNHHLDKKIQYDFYLKSIRSRPRYSKWHKKVESEDLNAVKEYYNYSERKALEAMQILSNDQIKYIRSVLKKD